jgi:hypothetical protein
MQRKLKGQSGMVNPEILGQHWSHKTRDKDNPDTGTTLVTQDTGQRQSRHWDNIGHTRHGTKTIQTLGQHWSHKTRDKDKQNIKHNTKN